MYSFSIAAFCLTFTSATAQESSVKNMDTAVTSSDTAAYNMMLRAVSNKKRLTKRLFLLLTRKPNIPPTIVDNQVSIDRQFMPYEGKIINDIHVIVLPPFGYDVRKFDSTPEITRIREIGNNSHANTRSWVMRNNLLFKKGQEIDPLIMAETESFIRDIGYVNDVHIQIDSISTTEANVTVVVRDNWSIGAYARNVSTKVDVEVFDHNFIGLGNNFNLRGIFNTKTERKFGGGVGYKYHNLFRTFINIDASYVDDILSRNQAVSIERPLQKNMNFFGQINHNIGETNLSQVVWDSISPTYNEEFSASLGYAFNPTGNNNTFVLSTRFLSKSPWYRGVEKPDNPEYFQFIGNRMALIQLSLFRQRHFRTHMVNSFGKIENFAYGYNVSAQFGYSEWPDFSKRGLYSSFRVAANRQYRVGSLYFEGAISSFFDQYKPFEGVLKLKLDMFSSLYRIGNQNYRHFLSVDYSKRLDYIPGFRNHNFTSNDFMSMKLKKVTNVTATEKLILKTEGDVFSSLNLVGFRLVFYTFADFGWIAGYSNTLLNKDNIYWGAGLGIRIRNDLLVFRTLEVKIGYYPRMNQHGFNSYINVDSSTPNISPNFTPKYPEEIVL